jgi:tRNA threonylcarbamoyladenosine biosynthesis protein TsaE
VAVRAATCALGRNLLIGMNGTGANSRPLATLAAVSTSHDTSSQAETEALGREFATTLVGGELILIEGDLGAGKTAFARGVIRGLGVDDPVTSPTFTLARRYDGGRLAVSHLDLYRLAEGLAGEDEGLLAEETGDDRVTLIEWPDRDPASLRRADRRVQIEHLGEDARRVTIE